MTTKKGRIVLVTLFAVLCLSTLVLAVNCPIPDTWQTKCYDDDSEITCPSPGEDFYGQDGNYNINPQSYTKLDENGNDLTDNATEWVIVRDNVTGLVWEVKQDKDDVQNYSNPHDADNTYILYDFSNKAPSCGIEIWKFINDINTEQFGRFSDWRIPTVKELMSIVDRDRYDPSINTTYFPNTESSCYWSSTAYDYFTGWGVCLFKGLVRRSYGDCDIAYVRAVRGGQCGPFENFIHNGNGTVTNTDTGLMWQQDTAPETYTWQEALSYCENLTLAGYDDWRLPNVNELHSIVDYSTYDPSIKTTFSPNTVSSYYWSSTSNAGDPIYAWVVYFGSGAMYFGPKSYLYYVRAVRSGQCGSLDTSTTTTISGLTTTTVPPCTTETLYGEYSRQTELLRHLRDNVLTQTSRGQELIRLYYEWSPVIVKAMEEDENFREYVKEMIDGVVELIEIGVE